MGSGFPDTIHTVTFDCWSTLIFEAAVPMDTAQPTFTGSERRGAQLAELLGVQQQLAAAAFSQAWQLHQRAWHRREAFTRRHMLDHTLQCLGLQLSAAQRSQLLQQ